jgi:hypothetical protein
VDPRPALRWWARSRRGLRAAWWRAEDGLRGRLAPLSRPAVQRRIGIDAAAGAALSMAGAWRTIATGGPLSWLGIPLAAGLVAFWVWRFTIGLLQVMDRAGRRRGPVAGLAVLALVLAGLGWVGWLLGLRHGAVPAAFVLLFGGWACLLTERRVGSSRRAWLRRATDVLAAILVAAAIVVGFSRDLVTTQPAAAVLFPLALWASVRTWRLMDGYGRLAVRAAADIVLSLLLGADLVLFLVWLANLLSLPAAEVATLRAVLARIDSVVDIPWWWWVLLYVLLAALSLALALLPGRLGILRRRWERLHVPGVVDLGRRALSGVHIGLMVTVLIGVAAPELVAAAVNKHLTPRYAVARQQQVEADAERAAYEDIARTFGNPSSRPLPVLTGLFDRIHRTDPPKPGAPPTDTEHSLARRLGHVQATALVLGDQRPAPLAPATDLGDATRFEPSPRDAHDLHQRLDELADQQDRADTARTRVREAADLAAIAVANTIQVAGLGGSDLVQLVKEYLQGLIEGSPLKDLLARWGARLPGADPPPPAEQVVEPDQNRLYLAAFEIRIQTTLTVRLADPLTPDPVLDRVRGESALDAVVDLTNETRYLEEQTGPCDGCPHTVRPGENPRLGPEHGGGPREPPIEPPPIHVR